ncbi:glutathione transferase [Aureococcus anophagefferens]|nr:glutathione transferase [Aureococcus anophagefferens]
MIGRSVRRSSSSRRRSRAARSATPEHLNAAQVHAVAKHGTCATYDASEMSGLEVCDDFELGPGDLLFLPQGAVHSARATEAEGSTHLTLGLAGTRAAVCDEQAPAGDLMAEFRRQLDEGDLGLCDISSTGCPPNTYSSSGYYAGKDCQDWPYLCGGGCDNGCDDSHSGCDDECDSCCTCTNCEDCPGGRYSSGSATGCAACPQGTYTFGGEDCTSCPAGYYGASSGLDANAGAFVALGAGRVCADWTEFAAYCPSDAGACRPEGYVWGGGYVATGIFTRVAGYWESWSSFERYCPDVSGGCGYGYDTDNALGLPASVSLEGCQDQCMEAGCDAIYWSQGHGCGNYFGGHLQGDDDSAGQVEYYEFSTTDAGDSLEACQDLCTSEQCDGIYFDADDSTGYGCGLYFGCAPSNGNAQGMDYYYWSHGCSECASGRYSSVDGATGCKSCPSGTYAEAGRSTCTTCAAGSYAGSGASNCTACPTGYVSTGETGAISLETACTLCEAGTYDAGTECDAAGATDCVDCAADNDDGEPGHYSTYSDGAASQGECVCETGWAGELCTVTSCSTVATISLGHMLLMANPLTREWDLDSNNILTYAEVTACLATYHVNVTNLDDANNYVWSVPVPEPIVASTDDCDTADSLYTVSIVQATGAISDTDDFKIRAFGNNDVKLSYSCEVWDDDTGTASATFPTSYGLRKIFFLVKSDDDDNDDYFSYTIETDQKEYYTNDDDDSTVLITSMVTSAMASLQMSQTYYWGGSTFIDSYAASFPSTSDSSDVCGASLDTPVDVTWAYTEDAYPDPDDDAGSIVYRQCGYLNGVEMDDDSFPSDYVDASTGRSYTISDGLSIAQIDTKRIYCIYTEYDGDGDDDADAALTEGEFNVYRRSQGTSASSNTQVADVLVPSSKCGATVAPLTFTDTKTGYTPGARVVYTVVANPNWADQDTDMTNFTGTTVYTVPWLSLFTVSVVTSSGAGTPVPDVVSVSHMLDSTTMDPSYDPVVYGYTDVNGDYSPLIRIVDETWSASKQYFNVTCSLVDPVLGPHVFNPSWQAVTSTHVYGGNANIKDETSVSVRGYLRSSSWEPEATAGQCYCALPSGQTIYMLRESGSTDSYSTDDLGYFEFAPMIGELVTVYFEGYAGSDNNTAIDFKVSTDVDDDDAVVQTKVAAPSITFTTDGDANVDFVTSTWMYITISLLGGAAGQEFITGQGFSVTADSCGFEKELVTYMGLDTVKVFPLESYTVTMYESEDLDGETLENCEDYSYDDIVSNDDDSVDVNPCRVPIPGFSGSDRLPCAVSEAGSSNNRIDQWFNDLYLNELTGVDMSNGDVQENFTYTAPICLSFVELLPLVSGELTPIEYESTDDERDATTEPYNNCGSTGACFSEYPDYNELLLLDAPAATISDDNEYGGPTCINSTSIFVKEEDNLVLSFKLVERYPGAVCAWPWQYSEYASVDGDDDDYQNTCGSDGAPVSLTDDNVYVEAAPTNGDGFDIDITLNDRISGLTTTISDEYDLTVDYTSMYDGFGYVYELTPAALNVFSPYTLQFSLAFSREFDGSEVDFDRVMAEGSTLGVSMSIAGLHAGAYGYAEELSAKMGINTEEKIMIAPLGIGTSTTGDKIELKAGIKGEQDSTVTTVYAYLSDKSEAATAYNDDPTEGPQYCVVTQNTYEWFPETVTTYVLSASQIEQQMTRLAKQKTDADCSDSTSWYASGNPSEDCDYVAEYASNDDTAQSRCQLTDDTGVNASSACPIACDTCPSTSLSAAELEEIQQAIDNWQTVLKNYRATSDRDEVATLQTHINSILSSISSTFTTFLSDSDTTSTFTDFLNTGQLYLESVRVVGGITPLYSYVQMLTQAEYLGAVLIDTKANCESGSLYGDETCDVYSKMQSSLEMVNNLLGICDDFDMVTLPSFTAFCSVPENNGDDLLPNYMLDTVGDGTRYITFGAGAEIEMEYAFTQTSTLEQVVGYAAEAEFSASLFAESKLNIVGAETEEEMALTTKGSVAVELGRSGEKSQARSHAVSISLGDEETGDVFAVKIETDTVYGTPIFTTIGGESTYGFEVQEGATSCEGQVPGDAIYFGIILQNTMEIDQVTADYPVNFNLQVDQVYAPWNAGKDYYDADNDGCGSDGYHLGLDITVMDGSGRGAGDLAQFANGIEFGQWEYILKIEHGPDTACDDYTGITISIYTSCAADSCTQYQEQLNDDGSITVLHPVWHNSTYCDGSDDEDCENNAWDEDYEPFGCYYSPSFSIPNFGWDRCSSELGLEDDDTDADDFDDDEIVPAYDACVKACCDYVPALDTQTRRRRRRSLAALADDAKMRKWLKRDARAAPAAIRETSTTTIIHESRREHVVATAAAAVVLVASLAFVYVSQRKQTATLAKLEQRLDQILKLQGRDGAPPRGL